MPDLTHIDAHGRASMVDVTGKKVTARRATARCKVTGTRHALGAMADPARSELLVAARLAGVAGAKAASSLIPLCHPLPLSTIDVEIVIGPDEVALSATVESVAQTGVEMEALTACALASLCIVAAVEDDHPQTRVDELMVWEKTGGRSGSWRLDHR